MESISRSGGIEPQKEGAVLNYDDDGGDRFIAPRESGGCHTGCDWRRYASGVRDGYGPRAVYLGWPIVNQLNRRTAVTQAPAPGRLNGVLPTAPRGQLCMLNDYVAAEELSGLPVAQNSEMIVSGGSLARFEALSRRFFSTSCSLSPLDTILKSGNGLVRE